MTDHRRHRHRPPGRPRGGRLRLARLVGGLLAVALAGAVVLVPTAAQADRIRDDQWQLRALQAQSAWRHANGSGVVVGVVDSGVDAYHHDLNGQVLPGVDLVEPGGDGRRDPVGHGTTVAALIAGRNDDRRGVAGLAPAAKILPVRVLNQHNRYDDARVVAAGLRWAVDHGARVVNLSLGGVEHSQSLADAIAYAFARDVVVVACGGNTPTNATAPSTGIWHPAREPGVVAVTGLTQRGGFWPGSLSGAGTVLAAPAANLVGARPGGYWRVQGTSFAAPLVSAAAALIRSRWPQMSAANVVNRLIRTAQDLGPRGRDGRYGFGAVDPLGALTRSVPAVSANPLAPPDGTAPEPTEVPTTVTPSDVAQEPPGAHRADGGDSPTTRLLWIALVVGAGIATLATWRRARRPTAAAPPGGPDPPGGS